MERAFASLEAIPVDPAKGHADVFTNANAPGTVDRFNYRFTGANPAQVKAIIVAQAALPPMGRKPGEIVIQRINSFTYQGGLLPKGLWVQVWAGDAPADLVLKALNELEAMTPKAGIPQEVRMRVPPGTGGGPKVTLNLMAADPLEVRDNLEKALAGAKP